GAARQPAAWLIPARRRYRGGAGESAQIYPGVAGGGAGNPFLARGRGAPGARAAGRARGGGRGPRSGGAQNASGAAYPGAGGPPVHGVADWQQADRRAEMIPASRRRLAVLHVVVASLLIALGARVWFVQVMSGTAYASQAKQEQTEHVIVPSVRGEILDDTG